KVKVIKSMKQFINKLKEKMQRSESEDEEYVELPPSVSEREERLYVRPYIIEDFSDLKDILDHLREGNTIALINIKLMREKDLVELKRAVAKLKKTVEAINGDIRGFGDDHIILVPSYVKIAKPSTNNQKKETEKAEPYYDEDEN
ncbi:MAG: cell division protein SepF, partial [Candidatus Woesearchaeota archaeon]